MSQEYFLRFLRVVVELEDVPQLPALHVLGGEVGEVPGNDIFLLITQSTHEITVKCPIEIRIASQAEWFYRRCAYIGNLFYVI